MAKRRLPSPEHTDTLSLTALRSLVSGLLDKIDFVGDQRKAVIALLRANRLRLYFDDFRRVEFIEMNDPEVFPNTEGSQTFDQMVDSLISTQYKIDMRPTIGQILENCPDIKEWNSLVAP